MKPAWDSLSTEYSEHPNVVIGDVDCTVEKDLCSTHGVSGYPTVKYWTDGGGKDESQAFNGGRSLEQLKKHVEDNMLPKCLVSAQEGCDEAERAYIAKTQAKGGAATELKRLEGMMGSAMKQDKKIWLVKRMHILKQL
ncbi:hypothetical protein M885DRAFT_511406 [Pelagophyceae sp. CCMP2097]|nr:hypothetical protein M885DRAFT_511406 [Pelagophyceae sp. CCMP2097]|mmetsp:Transcript_24314/g.81981  ORF Transcript_24314/g.81981 Transcript_24314/m.81981 type:complete len:138 (+) Transcript_24314:176-589(+)